MKDDLQETRLELLAVYSPAIALIVWAIIAAAFGFEHVAINVVMMIVVASAAAVAETVRRRRARRIKRERMKRREAGPITH
jgi:hypothetical protein